MCGERLGVWAEAWDDIPKSGWRCGGGPGGDNTSCQAIDRAWERDSDSSAPYYNISLDEPNTTQKQFVFFCTFRTSPTPSLIPFLLIYTVVSCIIVRSLSLSFYVH